MKKNVLHLIPSFHQGGSEQQALQLVKLLRAEGSPNIHVACLEKRGVLLDEVRDAGFDDPPEFPLTSFYNANMARQLRRFIQYVRRNEIEIVQTHDFYSNIFGMTGAYLAGVPVRIAAKRETGMRTRSQLFFEKRAFDFSDVVVANSFRVKEYLIASGVRTQKIEVIYNGIDIQRFEREGSDRADFLHEFGLPFARPLRFITVVANFREKVKNHEMFLRSAAMVAANFDDVAFLIAGEGDLLETTRQIAAGLGIGERTFFVGRCTRVPDLLAISEICVLSSRSEGFSNSIIEYMAAGRPVVATNVGGAAEAIVDGETGFLVESDDHQALAGRLIALLADRNSAEQMGRSGRERVAELFSPESRLARTLEIYDRELAKRSRNL